jgi:hypothetical protein
MKTDDLILQLSLDASPNKRWTPVVLLILAIVAGLTIAMIFSLLWFQPRSDLMTAMTSDYYVILKVVFAVSVVILAIPIVRQLTLPGQSMGVLAFAALLPFVAMAALAASEVVTLLPSEWHRAMATSSWLACFWKVPFLALPSFVFLSLSARQLAPTNLRLAGAYIGLLAGGIGTVGYALHCHDDSVSFVAIAYSVAIAEMTFLGALLGPRLLRWR